MSDFVAYRPIAGFPGYRVGDDGTVWSEWRRKGQGRGHAPLLYQSGFWHELKSFDKYGRPVVSLGRGNRRYVARLVLEAFVGPCPEGMESCHFPDSTSANCRLDNLRWGTSVENTDDQRKHCTLIGGEQHGMAKLTNPEVEQIRSLAGTMPQREIGERFGIKQPHVSDIINGKKRTPSSHAGKGLK
ncbi:MAG: HNH endonuclease [Pirellulales bacterium]|nr:HNH endonuclease [Pirellulales bacterium]